jgi:hypothetical protein
MNTSYTKEYSKLHKPTTIKKYDQTKNITIPNEKSSPALQVSFQQFNPGTSPPINNFMDRLLVRNLTY